MKLPLTRSLRKQTPMKIERFHMTLKKQIVSTYEKTILHNRNNNIIV
jgi:ABC-type transporter MlaC component